MTILIHIVGPQGSGKSSLARLIVAGAAGRAAHLHAEAARGMSNQAIRERFHGLRLVCVEAEFKHCRHADLLPGDAVMVIATTTPQETRDAA